MHVDDYAHNAGYARARPVNMVITAPHCTDTGTAPCYKERFVKRAEGRGVSVDGRRSPSP